AEAVDGQRDALLAASAAIQAGSEHPLARAVVEAAAAEGIAFAKASDVHAIAGRGVAAQVERRALRLGSMRLMNELKVDTSALRERAMQLQSEGRTVSWVADVTSAPQLLGLLAFGDTVKPSA